MSWEDLFSKYKKYNYGKKLVLFNQLFNWHRKKRMIRRNRGPFDPMILHETLRFKHDKLKQVAYYYIMKAQKEKPFIDGTAIEKRIYETEAVIKKQKLEQNVFNTKIIDKYLFIAHQIKSLAPKDKKVTIHKNTDLISSLSDSDLEILFENVCESLIADFKYLDDKLKEDLQETIAFAAEFYVIHIQHKKIENIIVDSLVKEIDNAPLDVLDKKIMSYYSQVSKMHSEKDTYEEAIREVKILEVVQEEANPRKGYKKLREIFTKNLQEAIEKSDYKTIKSFIEDFGEIWEWEDHDHIRRMVKGKVALTAEDIYVIITEMEIPSKELFK
ncbi:hypothetical protein [Neobacillus cucumis]|uniref:hypothetical protein n=1 Tax=Neobacillus cucumis TaxID=1740721 RepID=UPI0019661AD9|nr:hypothetical protein [Neobacillus cucumis]MBM7651774.1 hypothetical protein [Neobacillus cucumis]